jgi:acyl-coenzyme A synthetase/AMP-(fatty) acid ligase
MHTPALSASSYGVTTASFVPSQLHFLARELLGRRGHKPSANKSSLPCSSLRRVLSGGEALTNAMAAEIAEALPRCELHNTYGPTETTVGESTEARWAGPGALILLQALLAICCRQQCLGSQCPFWCS